jgi:hypothetical protein
VAVGTDRSLPTAERGVAVPEGKPTDSSLKQTGVVRICAEHQVVDDQPADDAEAWFEGLEGAFRHFGGVPREVLLDNAIRHDDQGRNTSNAATLH